MEEFKGTAGKWEMVFMKYDYEPKTICTGVGVSKDVPFGKYYEMVCESLLPETDKEYLGQREQIEANMKLIAAAPQMLTTLIEISEGKGRYNEDKLIHASNAIEDMIQLAKKAINEAI